MCTTPTVFWAEPGRGTWLSHTPACPPGLHRALTVIIGLPLNLALLGLYAWYRAAGSSRRFAASFAATAAALALATALALWHFQALVRGAARQGRQPNAQQICAPSVDRAGMLAPLARSPSPARPAPCRPDLAFWGSGSYRAAQAGTARTAASPTATLHGRRRGLTCCHPAHSECSAGACGGTGGGGGGSARLNASACGLLRCLAQLAVRAVPQELLDGATDLQARARL